MPKTNDYKRENFDINPEQQAEIACLQELIHAPTRKDAILTAIRWTLQVVTELRKGNQLYIEELDKKQLTKLMMLGINAPSISSWKYLVDIAHPWKRQLYVKGRKLPASTVWSGMIVNKLTRDQAADNWDLPAEAIDEIISYCESNKKFLELEAAEEKRRLNEKGIKIGLKTARR
jgi:histidinol phosphatase-like PHP family hydrolase